MGERLSEENMLMFVVPSEVPAEIGRLHLSETRLLIGPPPVGVDGCEWDWGVGGLDSDVTMEGGIPRDRDIGCVTMGTGVGGAETDETGACFSGEDKAATGLGGLGAATTGEVTVAMEMGTGVETLGWKAFWKKKKNRKCKLTKS